jgi:hypothetical protein
LGFIGAKGVIESYCEKKLGVVVPPAILATWEAEIWRIAAGGQPRQKVLRLHFNEYLGVVVHTCHPSYGEGEYK